MQKRPSALVSSTVTRSILYLVLAVGIGLSFYAFYAWRNFEKADARTQFAKAAADHMVVVRANILKATIATGYLGTVFEAAGTIDRDGFDYFARTVMKNNSAIERLAWLPVVSDVDRVRIEAEAAAKGVKGFKITDRNGLGGTVEALPRALYHPVFYITPREGNEFLVGLDFSTDLRVQLALEKAVSRGGPVAIPNKGKLFESDQPSYFIFVPVWNRASATIGRQIRGFVVGQIGLRHVVQDNAPPPGRFTPRLAIFDLSAPPSEQFIYPGRMDGITSSDVSAVGGSFWDIDVGIATWRIAGVPGDSLEPGLTWQSLLILFAGLAITAHLAAYLQLLRRRRRSVEELVHQRTEEVEIALAQLKLTEERLRDYVITGSDWYWDTGPDFRFTSVADRAREFGVEPDQLIGIDRLTDDDAPAAIEKRLAVVAHHEPFKDLRHDYAAGDRQLVFSLSGVPKFSATGEFRGYRGSARDITPQLRAEAEQRTARWAAERASAAKSTFLANMSHEIRTPMNGVLGMVQILRSTELNEEQRRMCEIISQSGIALLQILNDILDFSKLEADKIELEAVECTLPELVSDVVSLMRHTAEPKGISLVFEQEETSPPRVIADPTRIRQILLNLISNGIKFSTRGGVFIRLTTKMTDDNRLAVVIAVTDHGIGMSAEVLERLFKRFTQADLSSTRKFGGTGLGLAITRELVKLMDGEISVTSVEGSGSTFTVSLTLPLAATQGEAATPAAHFQYDGPQAHLNVLVAEDDGVNRLVIRLLLRAQGHDVTLVENGQQAVEAVLAVTYDLVLMDVMMPGMDGVTATRKIRELAPPASRVPIIALTANAMKGDSDSYLEAGMNAYVAKPIDKRLLFNTIEDVLGRRVWTPTAQETSAAVAPGSKALGDLENFVSSL